MADNDAYDRQLDHHRRAFETARRALRAEFGILTSAKEVEDLVISRAEEFGLDHTLDTLAKLPKDLQLDRAPVPDQMAIIRPLLKSAYEANVAMDKLLSERERVAGGGRSVDRTTNVQLFGRVVSLDPEKETIRYVDTGEEKIPTLVTVRPRPKLKEAEKTRER